MINIVIDKKDGDTFETVFDAIMNLKFGKSVRVVIAVKGDDGENEVRFSGYTSKPGVDT